jgi:hypothetical protein
MKRLGSDWEKAFARGLPSVLQSFQKIAKALLQSFHRGIEARAMETGSGLAGLAILGQQLQNYEAIFKDLTAQMVLVINERQRDANREFTPVIAQHLASAYQYCTNISGMHLRSAPTGTLHTNFTRYWILHEDEAAHGPTHRRAPQSHV